MDVADQGSGAYSDSDIVNRVPMARFARATDVAEAIAFLLDQERGAFIKSRQSTGRRRLVSRCQLGESARTDAAVAEYLACREIRHIVNRLAD